MNQTIRKKRLLYRCKQRGWLEVDLLLGTWASENIELLNPKELNQFEKLVNEETVDIYHILIEKMKLSDSLKCDDGEECIIEKIRRWCKKNPFGKADAERYKK